VISLASFVAALDEGGDPDLALVDRIVATTRDRSLAPIVEACALPRRFDAEIIGVLRGRPDDVAGNARLLRSLCEYPFVKPREAGGFVYHDGVRIPLLARFREERREPLRELTGRLVAHFEAAHATARLLEEDAARVGRIVQNASFARYRRLAGTLETRLLTPLLEAVYQQSLVSAREALDFLERQLTSYEDCGRYTVCRVLISSARDVVAGLDGDADAFSVLEWLDYWDGRLLERMERPERAETVLSPLASVQQRDQRLRQAALGELGQALRRQFRLREARVTFEAAISVGEACGEDLVYGHLRLAGTQMLLEQPAAAAAQHRKAIASASDPRALVCALTDLADAELRCGRRDDALGSALHALDVARISLPAMRAPHVALGLVLSACFAEEDPALLDTVFAETEALLAGLGDPVPLVRRAIDRTRLLRESGQRGRARSALARVEKAVGSLGVDIVRAEFAFELGALAWEEERWSDALEHFVDASDAAACARRPGLALDAQHQRARVLAAVGRVSEAAEAFADVERRWDEHGHEALAALAAAELAALLARGGPADCERSDALMASAVSRLGKPSMELRVRLLAAQASHASARGRSPAALALLDEAAELSAARGRLGDVVRFSSSSRQEAVDALAARGGYVRGVAAGDADRANAEAVRCLLTGEPTALFDARDQLGVASGLSPAPWYRLNQAYVAAHTGDWAEAVAALSQVLSSAPRLRCTALEARLGEFHVARGEALLAAGRYEEAAEAFAASVGVLDRPSQESARARCLAGRGDSLRATGDPAAAAAYREADAAGSRSASLCLGELLATDGHAAAALAAYRKAIGSGDDDLAATAVLRTLELPRDAAPVAAPPAPAAAPTAPPAASASPDAALVREITAAGPHAALLLGDRLVAAGRPAAAERAYRIAALALPEATLQLARLLRSREQYERAERDGDRQVALQAATELGDLLATDGDVSGAAAAYRRALARGHAPWAAVRLSRLRVREGRLSEAEQLLRKAAGERSEPGARVAATLALADLLAATGRGASAQRDLLTCTDPDTAAAAGLRLLADEGPDILGAVLEAGSRVALRLARVLRERGEHATAEDVLRRAAERSDDVYAPGASLALGDLLGGDTDAGREAYERALRSENPSVAPDAALRLRDFGHPDAIDRVIARGGLAALRLGRLLAERGEREIAERALERAAAEPVFAAEAAQALKDLATTGAHR
jgi:tetratricopeptide (TPR) repeat protein